MGNFMLLTVKWVAMNVDSIRVFCLSLSRATENLQWGDDLCFKIGGKLFATIALTAVPQKVCFKCTPEAFADLIERNDIHPAPYVGRYKWVILDRLDALRDDELREFILQSYEMVAAKVPKLKLRTSNDTATGRKRKSVRTIRGRKR